MRKTLEVLNILINTSPQDSTWKSKEQGEEAIYAKQKVRFGAYVFARNLTSLREQEQEQLAALREQMANDAKEAASRADKDFEGGYGGQEDLEDRYATTSGEH